MANFVGHEPCPKCGSRDNLGRWDDGSAFCFGCKYWEPPTHAPRRLSEDSDKITKEGHTLPDDIDTNFSAEAVDWLAQYHLSVEDAIHNNIRWSDSKQQLIFLLEDGCWQARNFNKERAQKRKYFTSGNVNDSIKLYLSNREHQFSQAKQLVVVEDCVSAIRVSKQYDAMPVLGSHIATKKLSRLARLYSSLIFWLDHDKLNEAKGLSTKTKLLGCDSRVIYTDLDPKCYTDEQIREFLSA